MTLPPLRPLRNWILGFTALLVLGLLALLSQLVGPVGDSGAPEARGATVVGYSSEGSEFMLDAARRGDSSTRRAAPRLGTRRGAYSAAAGQAFVYEFEHDTRVSVTSTEGDAAQELHYLLSGRVRLSVLDRREDEILVGIAFPELTFSARASGESADPMQLRSMIEPLRQRTLMRMNSGGTQTGFRFPEEFGGQQEMIVRGVMAGFQFVVPEGVEREWTTREEDATGFFEARYEEPVRENLNELRRINKKKFAYLAQPGTQEFEMLPWIRAAAHCLLDPALGWIEEADTRESQRNDLEGLHVRIENHSALCFHLVGVEAGDFAAPEDWEGMFEPIRPASDGTLAREHKRERMARRLADVELCDLLAQLLTLTDAGAYDSAEHYQLCRLISWKLRLSPECLDELLSWVEMPGNSRALTQSLLDCLADSNTTAGQAKLVDYMVDRGRRAEFRLATSLAMFNLERPGRGTFEAVRGLLSDDHLSPELKSTSLLLMGAFGRGERAAELGDAPLESLLSIEQQAIDSGMLSSWIQALGNTASPQALERVAAYSQHPEVPVRVAVVTALGSLPGPEQAEILGQIVTGDASEHVQCLAAEVLAATGTQEALFKAAEVLAHPRTDLRRATVLGLGALLGTNPAALYLLQQVAAADPSEEIRLMCSEMLSS